jgi:hypothetical protein
VAAAAVAAVWVAAVAVWVALLQLHHSQSWKCGLMSLWRPNSHLNQLKF